MIEMQQLHHLQDLDVQLEAKLAELEEIEAALGETGGLTEARDRVDHLRALQHEQEQRLRELEWDADKIKRRVVEDEAKLYGGRVRNPKELEGLQKDVAQSRARLREVEDRELELMADLEATQADLQRAQDELTRIHAAWEEMQRALNARQSDANATLADLRTARVKLVASVTSPILAEYERLRREKHGRAVSKIERSTCQGCRIALPMGTISRVRAGRELVHCPSCGRLLYT
jgi:predicted  nucleic acid-binding Zn-ribbon protein